MDFPIKDCFQLHLFLAPVTSGPLRAPGRWVWVWDFLSPVESGTGPMTDVLGCEGEQGQEQEAYS